MKLQPVVGSARWINNARASVYAVAVSASCFAGVHMFSDRAHYNQIVLAFVAFSPVVVGIAVYVGYRPP